MKLIDAIKNKTGMPYWIPDCAREDLPELFKQLDFKKGAEIGVFGGQNLVNFCKEGFEMYGIDPWENSDDNFYKVKAQNIQTIEKAYKIAVKETKDYPNCKLIKKTSMDAALDFPKESLDFVYIDANHSYGYVAMDLQKWTNRVKRGGIIAGHDYYSHKRSRCILQTSHAINGFIESRGIKNFYVLGNKNPKKNEKRDRELSFMFIKPYKGIYDKRKYDKRNNLLHG